MISLFLFVYSYVSVGILHLRSIELCSKACLVGLICCWRSGTLCMAFVFLQFFPKLPAACCTLSKPTAGRRVTHCKGCAEGRAEGCRRCQRCNMINMFFFPQTALELNRVLNSSKKQALFHHHFLVRARVPGLVSLLFWHPVPSSFPGSG